MTACTATLDTAKRTAVTVQYGLRLWDTLQEPYSWHELVSLRYPRAVLPVHAETYVDMLPGNTSDSASAEVEAACRSHLTHRVPEDSTTLR